MRKGVGAAVLVAMAGATAHAQQQQSALEEIDRSLSDLAREGYEVKAADDLREDIPKFVLQKRREHYYLPDKLNLGEEHCFQLSPHFSRRCGEPGPRAVAPGAFGPDRRG